MTIESAAEFRVPCPHERPSPYTGSCGLSNVLPDYHPLTASEITDLFEFVKTASDIASYAEAVTRLTQGIPGMTCPTPYEGDVADVMTWVERFMADVADGDAGNFAPLVVLVRVLAVDRS